MPVSLATSSSVKIFWLDLIRTMRSPPAIWDAETMLVAA
jgi:hypothetical protein